jgi:putative ABC transport system ATP-binding protein
MIEVKNLVRTFKTGDRTIKPVNAVSFELAQGTLASIVGKSGSGKSTLLSLLGALDKPTSGDVVVNGVSLASMPDAKLTHYRRRDIGFVFQQFNLIPNLSAADNVMLPMEFAGMRKGARLERARQLLEQVQLDPDKHVRRINRLSGGEQQRVALARAIVRTPKLLLLDEPLSNLDAQLREEMRLELKRLQRQIGITTVYVTHDQSEALALSDTIAVLSRGRIVQVGTPKDIYFRPASEFVARFLGATNLLPGKLLQAGSAGSRGTVEITGGARLACTLTRDEPAGAAVVVSARPESIRLVPGTAAPAASENALCGRVRHVTFLGSTARVEIAAAGDVVLQIAASGESNVAPGTDVTALFYADRTAAVPRDS